MRGASKNEQIKKQTYERTKNETKSVLGKRVQESVFFRKSILETGFLTPSFVLKTKAILSRLLGKKSKLIRFFDSWGRNPVFQFSLETFGEVG